MDTDASSNCPDWESHILSIESEPTVGNGSLADLWTDSSLMSAFPESGRSDHQILSEIKVRFRPEAVIQIIAILIDLLLAILPCTCFEVGQ